MIQNNIVTLSGLLQYNRFNHIYFKLEFNSNTIISKFSDNVPKTLETVVIDKSGSIDLNNYHETMWLKPKDEYTEIITVDKKLYYFYLDILIKIFCKKSNVKKSC